MVIFRYVHTSHFSQNISLNILDSYTLCSLIICFRGLILVWTVNYMVTLSFEHIIICHIDDKKPVLIG